MIELDDGLEGVVVEKVEPKLVLEVGLNTATIATRLSTCFPDPTNS
jgi:hypothetical protein